MKSIYENFKALLRIKLKIWGYPSVWSRVLKKLRRVQRAAARAQQVVT